MKPSAPCSPRRTYAALSPHLPRNSPTFDAGSRRTSPQYRVSAGIAPSQCGHQAVVPSAVADDDDVAGLELVAKDLDVLLRESVELVCRARRIVPEDAAVRVHQVNRQLVSGVLRTI